MGIAFYRQAVRNAEKACVQDLTFVDGQAYLADVIIRIVNGHPNRQIDDLLLWAYPAAPNLKRVA